MRDSLVTSASNSSCYIRNLMIFDIAIRVMTTAEVLENAQRSLTLQLAAGNFNL